MKIWLMVTVGLLMASCALGPDYKKESVGENVEYINQSSILKPDSGELNWWKVLDDSQLHSIIRYSFKRHTNILIAQAQLDEARALRAIARSAFYPSVQANADYTTYEVSVASPSAAGQLVNAGAIQRADDIYRATLDASWELDFFGSTRRKAQAANRSLDAIRADYENTILVRIAEVASAYFEYMGLEKHLLQQRRQIDIQQQLQALIEQKQKLGLSSELDVLRGREQLALLNTQLSNLTASRNASLYRLGLVSAHTPEEITQTIKPRHSATLPALIPIGSPADLLQRRPDIKAAERRLAAASAEIGVAKAEFFPKLVINASYGFEAARFNDIGSSAARTTGLVPAIQWPIFAGKQLRANYNRALARAKAAKALYDGTLLNAIVDAEIGLTNYSQSLNTLEFARHAVATSRSSAEKTYQLKANGSIDLPVALMTELQLISTERHLIDIETRVFINLIKLYKALGGSW